MGSLIHHDLIAEKLEMARTMGLVTKYWVRPDGHSDRIEASVRVWRSPTATDEDIKTYLTRLLAGLVSDRQIVVTPPPGEPERSLEGTHIEGTLPASVAA